MVFTALSRDPFSSAKKPAIRAISSNIVEIMKQGDVDGALIGGASLDPEELAKIAKFHLAG
jgi:hypothetical protein